ncbi:MAG: RluA family pseudouridine synthase [Ruminococcus sp.]|nr:RluA family pseudouridine synthase [Ruminococcus sp.]
MYFEFIVSKEYDGKTAKDFLRKRCGLTAETLKLAKYHAFGITRDGKTLRTVDTVFEGDIIKISLPTDKNEILPVEGTLDILYEDKYLIVINKPCGMPVHPVKVYQSDTLANLVAFHQRQRGEEYTFRALNRLDKDTSGCVVIAKDRITCGLLQGKIQKEYIAVCEGVIIQAGTVSAPIKLKDGSKIVREVREGGKTAVTHYEPISHSKKHTLLRLWLETGRTHQIRCHMSSLGHPLAGDDLYSGSLSRIHRQALHCYKVEFIHPITKESILLDTGIPEEFLRILNDDAI